MSEALPMGEGPIPPDQIEPTLRVVRHNLSTYMTHGNLNAGMMKEAMRTATDAAVVARVADTRAEAAQTSTDQLRHEIFGNPAFPDLPSFSRRMDIQIDQLVKRWEGQFQDAARRWDSQFKAVGRQNWLIFGGLISLTVALALNFIGHH